MRLILLSLVLVLPMQKALASLTEFRLHTDAPIESKKDFVAGLLQVRDEKTPLEQAVRVKGHGNSTWGLPKKPYQLKFEIDTALLGMPAAKDWVLLANYSDKTLLRNFLALSFSRRLRFPFASRAEFLELSLNDDYLGNYLVTEQVEIHPHRLALHEMKKKDVAGDSVTGAYLLEINQGMNGAYAFRTSHDVPFIVKNPREPQPEQAKYIHGYVQAAEYALFSETFADPVTGYASFLDVDQFVDWYIVEELFRNQDAGSWGSIYLYKERNGKLAMGPVWDFDIAAGNVDYDDNFLPEGYWIQKKSVWFKRLFEDPAFSARVAARWREIRPFAVEGIFADIVEKSRALDKSQGRNFQRWPILGVRVWPNYYVGPTYADEVEYLTHWLRTRISWLDVEWEYFPSYLPQRAPALSR